eukprot:PhM_4_TR3337/c0_g3_i1/m.84116
MPPKRKASNTQSQNSVPPAAEAVVKKPAGSCTVTDLETVLHIAVTAAKNDNMTVARRMTAFVKEVFEACTPETTATFIVSAAVVTALDDLMEATGLLEDTAAPLSRTVLDLHRDVLVILDYAADSDEGKTECGRRWTTTLVTLMGMGDERPYDLLRCAAGALVNIVKGAGKRLVGKHVDALLNSILRNTGDMYLQMQIIEIVCLVIASREVLLDDVFHPNSAEGRRLADALDAIRVSDGFIDDIVRTLQTYNRTVRPANIVTLIAQKITFHSVTLANTSVFFGKTLMLLGREHSMTVPYSLVRSIRIVHGSTLVFKLHSVPEALAAVAEVDADVENQEVSLSLEKSQLDILKTSDIKKWIQTEQTKANMSQHKSQAPTQHGKKGLAKPPQPKHVASEVNVGAYLASSADSQGRHSGASPIVDGPPAVVEAPSEGDVSPQSDVVQQHHDDAADMFDFPQPKPKRSASRKSAPRSKSASTKKRGRDTADDAAGARPSTVSSVASAQRASHASLQQTFDLDFNFGVGPQNPQPRRIPPPPAPVPSPINFSQLESETPRGDEDFDAILSQFRRVMSENVSRRKQEGVGVLMESMERIQEELDGLKSRTEALRANYVADVRGEVAKLREQEHSMKTKMTNAVNKLNDEIGRLMQQTSLVSDHVTALEVDYLQVANDMKAGEEESLLSLKTQVEQHMRVMEEKIEQITNNAHPIKYLMTYVTKKMQDR